MDSICSLSEVDVSEIRRVLALVVGYFDMPYNLCMDDNGVPLNKTTLCKRYDVSLAKVPTLHKVHWEKKFQAVKALGITAVLAYLSNANSRSLLNEITQLKTNQTLLLKQVIQLKASFEAMKNGLGKTPPPSDTASESHGAPPTSWWLDSSPVKLFGVGGLITLGIGVFMLVKLLLAHRDNDLPQIRRLRRQNEDKEANYLKSMPRKGALPQVPSFLEQCFEVQDKETTADFRKAIIHQAKTLRLRLCHAHFFRVNGRPRTERQTCHMLRVLPPASA